MTARQTLIDAFMLAGVEFGASEDSICIRFGDDYPNKEGVYQDAYFTFNEEGKLQNIELSAGY